MLRIITFCLCAFLNLCFAQKSMSIDKEIDSLFSFVDESGPGLSVAVVQNNQIIYNKGIGYANLEYDILNNNRGKFDIASIAKQFTASCIWVLVNQNKISLDDDIRKFLPEIPDYGEIIKIRHLLNHTSGIRGYTYLMELSGFDSHKNYFDNQTIFKLACKQQNLNNIPGEKVVYGNTNFNLLTIIIERITGGKFSTFAKKNIFSPLNMNETFYRDNEKELVKNRVVGYKKDAKNEYYRFPRIQQSHGAGSLWSSVTDLVKWTNLFTEAKGEYRALIDFLITKDVLTTGEISSYARGIMVDDYKGYETIHHSGFTSGYQSQIITVPSLKISVIILTNLESINPSPISYKILDLFLKEEVDEMKFTENKIEYNSEKLIEFKGDYQELNSDLRMTIHCENNTLKAKSSFGKSFTNLKRLDENTFCRVDNQSVKYKFGDSSYDLIVYFGGTPFYFKQASYINAGKVNTKDYVGNYFSEELNVKYRLFIEEGELCLSYPNNTKIKLYSGQKDEFGTGRRMLLSFNRSDKNKVNSFSVASGGVVKDILFKKIQ
jgi:CubicO group peptidase (beta-lactamase class C family)